MFIWMSNSLIVNFTISKIKLSFPKSLSSEELKVLIVLQCFPGALDGKVSAYNVGDPGSIPGLGRSPGEGNGNPLQYSCLENSMDRGAWQATVHRVARV